MKKILPLALVVMLAATSCFISNDADDSYIIDWNYINLYIQVQDKSGNDLLKNGTIDIDKITIKGGEEKPFKVYDLEAFKEISKQLHNQPINEVTPLRALPAAIYYGAGIIESKGQHVITIGEYYGGSEYNKESIIIQWGDGTQDLIQFSRTFKGSGRKTKAVDQIYLNGKRLKQDSHRITIRK